jgi:hypothetical protein
VLGVAVAQMDAVRCGLNIAHPMLCVRLGTEARKSPAPMEEDSIIVEQTCKTHRSGGPSAENEPMWHTNGVGP